MDEITKGLVLGSFCPLHLGHCAMIDFASENCDKLYVLVCNSCKTCDKECKRKISGIQRLWWLNRYIESKNKNIELKYSDAELPGTSVSNFEISRQWAEYLKSILDFDIIFTSERYGDYVAEILGIKHMSFNIGRNIVPVSSTKIRNNPFKYWEYLPDFVRPYYVKKICICGTESTGKTILVKKLAKYFNTNYVPEWGRIVVNKTMECTYQNLLDIGYLHAKDIYEKRDHSNKLLFCDTDLNTTKIYSIFLFNREATFDKWIEDANKFDLHLFLDNNVPYIQDGTRLNKEERDRLQSYYLDYYNKYNIPVHIIRGTDWGIRFEEAVNIIKTNFSF